MCIPLHVMVLCGCSCMLVVRASMVDRVKMVDFLKTVPL